MEYIVNGIKYQVIRLLGHGKGGYSYLVSSNGKNYVLKQIHHEKCDYYEFGNKIESEYNDYKKLKNVGIRMPEMYFIDFEQEIIIKEYIEGLTIFDLVLKDKVKKTYFDQIEEMCLILYRSNLNIDYFPTNFVVRDDLLYYVDYECNQYMDKWNFKNWGIKYWSRTVEFEEYLKSIKK